MKSSATLKRLQMLKAEKDIHEFVRRFCVTLNKDAGQEMPFPWERFRWTRPYFDLFLFGLDNPDQKLTILWEKAAQMMASWSVMMSFLWALLFRHDIQGITISKKQELVDDRFHSPNSLLGKIRFAVPHLPAEWREKISWRNLGIECRANNSTVVAETAHPDAGRGGAWSMAELDEAAFNDYGEDNFKALKGRCYGPLVLTSTPNYRKAIGEDVFSRLRWQTESGLLKILTTPWHLHPDRGPAWFQRETETMTPAQVNAELLIKYGKGASSVCFYTWERIRNVRRLGYDPGLPIIRSWDFGVGMTAVVHAQLRTIHTATGRALKQIRVLSHYEAQGKAACHYRDVVAGDVGRWPRARIFDIGDPYILDQRHANLDTWRTAMAEPSSQHPYQVTVRPAACMGVSIENLIENVCRLCQEVETKDGNREPQLVVDEGCKDLILHLENYAYPTDRQGKRKSDKPVKDHHSHAADALQYLAWDQCPPGRAVGFDKSMAESVEPASVDLGMSVGSSLEEWDL